MTTRRLTKRIGTSTAIAVALVAVAAVSEGIDSMTQHRGATEAPAFPTDVEWLNTSRPPTMEDLRGKVVMLDFWTYCCINCIHVIPDLKRLEAEFADELVVVGVHSAKFTAEQGTDNIRQAVLRYGIEHPVVNDHEFRLWRQYAVRAWPTVALVDPEGKVATVRSGEGVYDAFAPVVREMVAAFDAVGSIDRTTLELDLETDRAPSSLLSFPGKLVADETAGRLYISDSNHNRIVVATLAEASEVVRVVGSGESGFEDGPAQSATFNQPQGMALGDGVLYVADTENHAIREIDLETWVVTTLAGTGRQATRHNTPGIGREVDLNSPWDLHVEGRKLFVAMAGAHQIWAIDLSSRRAAPHAGSARENRTDGALRSAALAQPSCGMS